jgi:Ca-activated chloride channel homolog
LSLGQPSALALLTLALPIVAVYLLRGNPRRRSTSAAFLWRGLDEQVTARRKWRRPPRSLALFLQLLALLAGAIALARPAAGEVNGRQVIYVLDASGSMQSTDIQPSRFEAARSALRQELAKLSDADRGTLIRLGQLPEVIASEAGRTELSMALDRIEPGAAPANLRDALAAASQHVERIPSGVGQDSEIVVFSDGTLAQPRGIGPLPLPVRFVKVGNSGANQGVSALQVRRAAGEAARLSGFARVTNYDERPARVPVRLAADGVALETRSVELPARGRAELSFDVPPGARSVSVALAGDDGLALDDRAQVTVPENRRRSALLVSRSPEAWQQALSALPGLDLVTQAPPAYRDVGAEVVVFDGFVPPSLPGGQLLLVNPPNANGVVDVVGDLRDAHITSFDSDHPLLRSLDLGSIRLVKASRLAVPRWASSVAETAGGPLIIQGQLDGRRVVVLGFDPLVSGLEKLVTFPILVANTVEYLGSSRADPWVPPGQTVTLPISQDVRQAVLERPNGSRQALPTGAGAVTINSTDQVGRYTLYQQLGSGEPVGRTFYVDLFGETEADTAPRERASWPAAGSLEDASPRLAPSIWMPFVAVCLGLLAVEWFYFIRRG